MRKSAQERREDVVRAALSQFSGYGFHGTPTDAIAREVGVSQPYLFRLYPSKRDIFLAAGHDCFQRIYNAFDAATHGKTGEEALAAMREAYREIAEDRELLLMQLQLYVVSSSDEKVRQQVTVWWNHLWELLIQTTGLSHEEITDFMACGMLINVMVALGVSDSHPGWIALNHGHEGAQQEGQDLSELPDAA